MQRNERKQSIRRDMLRQRAFLTPEERQLASRQLAIHLQAFLESHFPNEGVTASQMKPHEGVPSSQRKQLHIAVYAAMRNELDLSSCWELLQNWPAVLYFPAVIKRQGESPAVIKTEGESPSLIKTECDSPSLIKTETSENTPSDRLWFAPLPAHMKPSDLLSPRTFGVPEPPPEACLAPENLPPLDLILVPGLAFDQSGNRIGWGKAYYDGFLATIRSNQTNNRSNQKSPPCIGACYDFQLLDQELPHDDHDQRLQGVLTPSGWHPTRSSNPTHPTLA